MVNAAIARGDALSGAGSGIVSSAAPGQVTAFVNQDGAGNPITSTFRGDSNLPLTPYSIIVSTGSALPLSSSSDASNTGLAQYLAAFAPTDGQSDLSKFSATIHWGDAQGSSSVGRSFKIPMESFMSLALTTIQAMAAILSKSISAMETTAVLQQPPCPLHLHRPHPG